jgi:hypothetical protein
MKIKINLNVLAIVIMTVVVVVITVSIIMARATYSNSLNEGFINTMLQKTNLNSKSATNPVTLYKNNQIADAHRFLLFINVTQRVLERTVKANEDIAFMAVYLDDGTIIAHYKPERIGRNMFDVDVEFSDYTQDIFDAINNGKTFRGVEYDPLLNEYIKFMVKPLHIDSFDQNLSLLIGVHETSSIKKINNITMFSEY